MQLWGKLVSAIFLLAAAGFAIAAAVAKVSPRDRLGFLLVVAISLVVAFGMPLVVRLFSSFTGDEDVLRSGVLARATIRRFDWTRWSFGRYSPIMRFELTLVAPGAVSAFRVTQAVDPKIAAQLAPGVLIGIRIDPKDPTRAVIDWREPIGRVDK